MATTRCNCAERWRPLRCTALLLALAGTAAQSASQGLRPTSGAQQTAVDIPADAIGDSRLQIQFDTTLTLRGVSGG